VASAIGRVRDDVRLPVADELTVKTELVGAFGGGPICVKHIDEIPGICHAIASHRGHQLLETPHESICEADPPPGSE
jgi:hypothetical protein